MSSSGGHPKQSYIGVYDKEILCEACDGELGKLDQHAAERLLGGEREALKISDVDVRRYPRADPLTLVRFLASVAWRAGVSSHPYFDRVTLGPYEPKLKLISTGQLKPTSEIECLISEYDIDEVPQLNPTNSRIGEVNFVVLYASRFVFYLKLDKRPLPPALRMATLTEGQQVLSMVRPWTESKEFELLKTIVRKNQKPKFWKPQRK